MQRKLASVQKIEELLPIEGADFVVAARVLGWTCVVRKDWFQPGDLGVYFEIDSILPENPVWDDIVAKYNYRIKTQKFRGVISQGFMIPLSMIPEDMELGVYTPQNDEWFTITPKTYQKLPEYAKDIVIGVDLTEKLGVKKWEPQESGGPGPRNVHRIRTFPGFIPKTDEIRVQSAPKVIEELRGKAYYISVKMDGTSFTAFQEEMATGELDPVETPEGIVLPTMQLRVCSRNNMVKEEDNDYWYVARKYRLEYLPLGYAIQGELCGPSWQKNRLNLKEPDLFVFNVFNIKEGRYLGYDEFSDFCWRYNLQKVPVIELLNEFDYSLEELIEKAKGRYASGNHREGIVVRPIMEMYSTVLKDRLSFKVINNDYLLKGGEE